MKVLKKIVKSNYFLLKGFIYLLAIKELFGKKSIKQYFQNNNNQLIFYCSSYSHFDTVKSLLIKCEKSKYDVCLITSFELNKEDNNFKNVSVFDNFSIYVVSLFKADILITAHVGFRKINQPRNSKILHFLVSLTSLDGVYGKDTFDDCDYVICAGRHQIDDFFRWKDDNRKLKGVTLIPGGYPKLDSQKEYAKNLARKKNDTLTVVYAPTHIYDVNKNLASLREYGEDIIKTLLELNYKVIFRPHPVSLNDRDKGLVQKIIKEYRGNNKFVLDDNKRYMDTYNQSDFMITDLSGTGFTYSFTFEKPVIFFAHNISQEKKLTGIQYDNREDIGYVSRDIKGLKEASKNISHNMKIKEKSILNYRKELIYNLNTSSNYCFDSIEKILKHKENDDWITL